MMTPVLDTFCTIYFGDDDVVEDDDDDVVEDVDDEEEHDRGSCILQRLLWLVFTHHGILGLVDKDPPHLQSHTHTHPQRRLHVKACVLKWLRVIMVCVYAVRVRSVRIHIYVRIYVRTCIGPTLEAHG